MILIGKFTGVVVGYDVKKCFGFIKIDNYPPGDQAFIHQKEILINYKNYIQIY